MPHQEGHEHTCSDYLDTLVGFTVKAEIISPAQSNRTKDSLHPALNKARHCCLCRGRAFPQNQNDEGPALWLHMHRTGAVQGGLAKRRSALRTPLVSAHSQQSQHWSSLQ